MSADRYQVGVLPSPRSSSEKKDPGLRVFSGYSCILWLQLCVNRHSHNRLRPNDSRHDHPRDRRATTKANKLREQSLFSLRFCVSIIGLDFSFLVALREGGHAPCEESWLVHASQPQSTHTLPCLVCHSVLIYNTREAPCSSLGGLSGRSLRRTLRVQVVA